MKDNIVEGIVVLHLALALLAISCDNGQSGKYPESTPSMGGTVLRIDPAIDQIVPGNYRIEKLATGFGFIEGPIWVNENGPSLLFSDLLGNVIYQWKPDGQVRPFIKPVFTGMPKGVYGPNGLTLDSEGRLVICEHGNRRISRIEKNGKKTVLASHYRGMRLNSPNDAVYKSDGWLYFTDPPHGLRHEDRNPTKELNYNGVFRLSPDRQLELLNKSQTRPNGLAFSPDEKTLYVTNSDSKQAVLFAYAVLADGTLGKPKVFYDFTSAVGVGGPDGVKVDRQGNVYSTAPGGVWIFSPDGKHLGTILPEEKPANVGWGDDGKTLYMTARTSLYRIKLKIEGVRP